jgi:hypothetical protein
MGVHGNFHWASPAGNPIGLSGHLRGLSLVYREAVKLRYCDSIQSIWPIHLFLVLGAWNLSSMTGLQAFQAIDRLRAWLSASIDMILSFQR